MIAVMCGAASTWLLLITSRRSGERGSCSQSDATPRSSMRL